MGSARPTIELGRYAHSDRRAEEIVKAPSSLIDPDPSAGTGAGDSASSR